jgi:hypothetical protein
VVEEVEGNMQIFIPLLSALFIGLKLSDIIDWSWWWVLSPIWIGGVFQVLLVGAIAATAAKTEKWRYIQ